jgi:hypothetical protein
LSSRRQDKSVERIAKVDEWNPVEMLHYFD